MENKSKPEFQVAKNVSLSIDLRHYIPKQVEFLHLISRHPKLFHGAVLREAVRRYEQCWMPLIKDNVDQLVTPPLDVNWVWHCHMLSPLMYRKDCMKILGKVIDHTVGLHSDEDAIQRGRQLWTDKYPGEHYSILQDEMVISDEEYSSICEYKLYEAAGRQADFCYQVASPHYLDPSILESAFIRYCKYLYIRKTTSKSFVPPTIDIDICWHTHQLFPSAYKQDTEKTLGYILNHNDNPGPRAQDGLVARGFKYVDIRWMQLYGEKYRVPGVVYRGPMPQAPHNFFSSMNYCSMNGSTSFSFTHGEFKNETIGPTDDLQSFWGPLPLSWLFPPMETLVATHRISGHFGKHDLTMRIVHSADKDLMISAAQVWCDGEMVVMGHSLGKEQLPRPEQLSKPNKLVFKDRERCMLIKDIRGDWAFCFGGWIQGEEINNGDTEMNDAMWKDNSDIFILRIFEVHPARWTNIEVTRSSWPYIRLGKMTVNMDTCEISMNGEVEDSYQHLCLGFSLAILLTLTRESSDLNNKYDANICMDMGKMGISPCRSMLQASGFYLNFPGRKLY